MVIAAMHLNIRLNVHIMLNVHTYHLSEMSVFAGTYCTFYGCTEPPLHNSNYREALACWLAMLQWGISTLHKADWRATMQTQLHSIIERGKTCHIINRHRQQSVKHALADMYVKYFHRFHDITRRCNK